MTHRYEIIVDGQLTSRAMEPFPSLEVEQRATTTVLSGEVRDSAQLHGVIDHLLSLGVHIKSLIEEP